MGLRKLIREWLVSDIDEPKGRAIVLGDAPVTVESDDGAGKPKMRFELVDAINGRLLKVATYKFNPHGPDWTCEIYVMREDESVGDAVNTLMVMKGN
jgi:hypothetical protein